jgi:alcohol dehydrogenase/L-iditol 2-dehydrogenase
MSARMTAVVNYGPEPRSVELRDVALPVLGASDVLLEVAAVSVCGSDVHQWLGANSWKVNYPCTLGHEFAGTIAAVGAEVSDFQAGDRVTSETAAVIDETSPYSRRGLYNLDPGRLGFGYGVDGAMTRFVRVPRRCLHRLPPELPFERAALTEPCCVAYNAVCVQTAVTPGDHVLVLGPGPIGLLCGLLAQRSGAHPVLLCGLAQDQRRLRVAETLGLEPVLDTEVLARVRALGDGIGVDVVIDATGASASLEVALAAVRPAGQITKVGWGPQPLGFNLDAMVQKGIRLQGSFSHNWPIWERVIRLLANGQIPVETLIDRVEPLESWQECFAAMHAGEIVKAVLTPRSP